MMKILCLHLVIGCYCTLCVPVTTLAHSTITDNTQDESIILSHGRLGFKEMQYIQLECEGFAIEDGIATEKRPAYIKTCIDELSAVVKHAIKQLEATDLLPAPSVNSTNSMED